MKYTLLIIGILSISFSSYAEICGKKDDRIPSFEKAVGRFVKAGETGGCNITLIGNNCAITAGHCGDKEYAEFNVAQAVLGIPGLADEKDVYQVESYISENKGIGSNWGVVKLKANNITHKKAHEVEGFYNVGLRAPVKNSNIKVISYGGANNESYPVKSGEVPSNPYADKINFSQQVSKGKLVKAGIFLIPSILEHDADASYGSAGAPIVDEKTNVVVGINTHGGCRAVYVNPMGARFTNSGTSIYGNKKFKKAILSCLNK